MIYHRWIFQQAAMIGDGLVDLLFPRLPSCPLCGKRQSVDLDIPVCQGCFLRFTPVGDRRCFRCGRPGTFRPKGKHICARCSTSTTPLSMTRSYGIYDGYLRDCIHALKYRANFGVSRVLGALMGWIVAMDGGFHPIDVIVPVPLHVRREEERGYNQAKLLADVIGGYIRVGVRDVVARVRETVPQNRLAHDERTGNVRGAFRVVRPDVVRDRRILIVDDVRTTGSTMDAVALALRRAGAKRCVGITAAAGALDRDYSIDSVSHRTGG